MTRTANEAIHSYVTDMSALEKHIATALKGQIEDAEDDVPSLATALRSMHQTVQQHQNALERLEMGKGKGGLLDVAGFIKRAATTVAGAGAAAVDMVRTERLPKNLRDDYTAFSLAIVGYAMLYTTARALEDEQVANIAEAHLKDYTSMSSNLMKIIPSVVVSFLREEGQSVDANALSDIERRIGDASFQPA